MSREERRAYQRQMKGMERTPQLPPAAQQRAERNAARKAERRARRAAAQGGAQSGAISGRFVLRSVLIAIVVGVIGFSLQWSEGMPRALYVGLAVGFITLALIFGFRFLMRRMPAPPRT